MRRSVLTAAMVLVAGLVFGADIDGKWTGTIPGMDGNPVTLHYTFKADGDTLTGTSRGPDGQDYPIKDGKIAGENITFAVVVDFGGNEMRFDYKGVVSPDQIKLTLDMMGQPTEILLKRAE